MSSFRISVDLGALIPSGSPLNKDVFPTLAYAVQRIAGAAQAQWISFANGAPLPDGKSIQNRTGEYARSIQLRMTGDFAGEVYSDLPYAKAIEEGSPARDLKTMLSSSLKVRVSADGHRYLIIPFRHDHPNSVMGNGMPMSVWEWWQDNRKPSSITGTYRRVSGTGVHDIRTRQLLTVPGWKYNWGTRLTVPDLESLGVNARAASRMAGMVQFRKPGGTGGSAHSQYITFRVMSEKSNGWQVPAQPGKYPARTTAEQLQPVAEQAFRKAVAEDVARALGGATT